MINNLLQSEHMIKLFYTLAILSMKFIITNIAQNNKYPMSTLLKWMAKQGKLLHSELRCRIFVKTYISSVCVSQQGSEFVEIISSDNSVK